MIHHSHQCPTGDVAVTDSLSSEYMYEQNAVDRERLRLVSRQLNQLTSEACLRAGLGPVMRLMRPGGRIIALEPLRDPGFPRLDPPIPAVERIRDLDIAHIRARGLPYDIAWEYGEVFQAAGLKLLEWRGHFSLHTTDTAF